MPSIFPIVKPYQNKKKTRSYTDHALTKTAIQNLYEKTC